MPRGQQRRAHRLKANRNSEKPRQFIFFDTETTPVADADDRVCHHLKLGVACYWRREDSHYRERVEWFTFTDPGGFWEWALSKVRKKSKLYLISHNLDFDLAVTQGYRRMRESGFKLLKFWEKPPARLLVWNDGNRTVCGMDNGNYFRGSLEEIGQSVGLEKLSVDFAACTDEELEIYCKRDVEILLYLWQKWLAFAEENDLGNFMPTLAGQAFTAFRHRFMTHDIMIHDREDVSFLERQAYSGGRVECFFLGRKDGGRFYYLDINSMYPYVMRNNEYPVKLIGYRKDVGVDLLEKYLRDYCLVAKVRVKTSVALFPVKQDGKVFYPVGEFDCCLSTPEIREALSRCEVLKVYEVAVYEKANIFREYVDFFYAKRLEAKSRGDKVFSFFFKIMLNSLYGKFGQKSSEWEVIGECDPDTVQVMKVVDAEDGRVYTVRMHNGIVERKVNPGEAYNSFPAIAAHVTAYARVYLWSLVEIAGVEHVYYIDTDSLFVDETGYYNLNAYLDDAELGLLKLEKTGDYIEVRAPKDYTFGKDVKHKGIRKNAEQVDVNRFVQDKWLGFASRLRLGNLDTYYVVKQEKSLSWRYTKGIVGKEGWVKPFCLPEDARLI